jgi:hypothetical protein
MDIKTVNPDDPNALKSDEKVVFGQMIFILHSQDGGEINFPPMLPGLVQVETGKRASEVLMYKKRIERLPPLMRETTTYDVSLRPWFVDKDGTFFWILPVGTYKIDALSWFAMTVPMGDQKLYAEPKHPPECGFLVCPNVTFSLSGEQVALYLGTLIIDMNVEVTKLGQKGTLYLGKLLFGMNVVSERAIVIKNINRVSIKDDYDKTFAVLKSRFPSFNLIPKKSLMVPLQEQPPTIETGRCPSMSEAFARGVAEFILRALGGH